MAKQPSNTESIDNILRNKSLKAKNKTAQISQLLLDYTIRAHQLIPISADNKGKNKAILIESLEHASKTNPELIDSETFRFLIESLKDEVPRVKWESAKAISHTAHLYPKLLEKAVMNLLSNTAHSGTVVRWSAAGALSKILHCQTSINKKLVTAIENILKSEADNAIRKIYQKALKKSFK
ncbi:MAG TPA: hypothetical protein VEB63_08820 [Chitinophagaceae bacterium]|nr:hypothetical protein [Chitinophagaceae bacterium]